VLVIVCPTRFRYRVPVHDSPGKVVLVDNKKVMAQTVDAITFKIEQAGSVCAILPAPIRTFSSGKSGFGAYGKTMLPDGRTLQLSINAVILTPAAK
jgi:hypothetical protein